MSWGTDVKDPPSFLHSPVCVPAFLTPVGNWTQFLLTFFFLQVPRDTAEHPQGNLLPCLAHPWPVPNMLTQIGSYGNVRQPGDRVVAKSPVAPASNMGINLSPGCSTSNPATNFPRKAEEEGPCAWWGQHPCERSRRNS